MNVRNKVLYARREGIATQEICSEGGRVDMNVWKTLWLILHGGVGWVVAWGVWDETEWRNVTEIYAGRDDMIVLSCSAEGGVVGGDIA